MTFILDCPPSFSLFWDKYGEDLTPDINDNWGPLPDTLPTPAQLHEYAPEPKTKTPLALTAGSLAS